MYHCQVCEKMAATVHSIEMVDGKPEEKHLCQQCAESSGVVHKTPTLKIPEFFEQLLTGSKARKTKGTRELECPGCGMSYQQFKLRGRMGCPRCYEVFRRALDPLLEKVHEGTRHKGRFPAGLPAPEPPAPPPPVAAAPDSRQRRLAELAQRLEAAKRSEAYEEAARIRDEIRRLQMEQ